MSRGRWVGMGCSTGTAEHADFIEQLQVVAGVWNKESKSGSALSLGQNCECQREISR